MKKNYIYLIFLLFFLITGCVSSSSTESDLIFPVRDNIVDNNATEVDSDAEKYSIKKVVFYIPEKFIKTDFDFPELYIKFSTSPDQLISMDRMEENVYYGDNIGIQLTKWTVSSDTVSPLAVISEGNRVYLNFYEKNSLVFSIDYEIKEIYIEEEQLEMYFYDL